jgi:formylglycine-generating enzyme required for sulfatase activity
VTSFTPAYGAPEQFSRTQGATGPWTDVYALALVMSELLIGQPPLEGDDFIQLGMASANPQRRPTPASFGVPVDAALEEVLLRALAVRPQDRYPTAGEFWQGVRASQHLPTARTTGDPRGASWVAGQGAAGALTAPRPVAHAATELSTSLPFAAGAKASLSSAPHGTAKRRTPLLVGALSGLALLALLGSWLSHSRDRGGASAGQASVPALASGAAVGAAPSASAAAPLVCPEGMALIAGGKFFMGSDDKDADPDERPAHQVSLSAYCIDLHEVTTAEYQACSDVGECKRAPKEVDWPDISPLEKRAFSPLCNAGAKSDRTRHPINCVDWDMASAYCAFGKKRLPSEAEWEFAARGPDGRRYPWGDEMPDKTRMNACGRECLLWGSKNGVEMGVRGKGMYPDDDGFPGTAPVGSFPAGTSRYGLFDVVGNVWEWTQDWEGKYGSEPASDPTGPSTGERRVVRGGAFNGAMPSWVRPSQRYSDAPSTHSHAYGFRCAKSQ